MFPKIRIYLAAGCAVGLLSFPARPSIAEPLDPRVEQYTSDPNGDKISVNLLKMESDVKTGTSMLRNAVENNRYQMNGNGVVVEIICTSVDKAISAKISAAGVRVLREFPQFNRVNAAVSNLAALHDVASLPEVVMIRSQFRPKTNLGIGAVNGRAPRAMRADVVRTNLGFDGTGVKVGILSDSFSNTAGVRNGITVPAVGVPGTLMNANDQLSGDLPAAVDILADTASDGEDEGAAIGELVHDVAPGSAIAFYTAFNSEADFANGITQLRTTGGCKIIADDVSYFDEPVYQSGIVQQAAEACVANNCPYFSSAGNSANLGLRVNYVDIDARHSDSPRKRTGKDLHDWGNSNGYLPITFPPNSEGIVILDWNQPNQSVNIRAGAQIDLDLYMTPTPDAAGLAAPLAVSNDVQGKPGNGRGDALEGFDFQNTGSSAITGYLAVDKRGARSTLPQSRNTPLEFALMVFDIGVADIVVPSIPSNDSSVGGPTLFGHPQGAGVASVAAVPWWESPQFNPAFPPSANIDPEYFTSRGGALTQFFDTAGKFSVRTALHPTISSIDGCNTTFFFTPDANVFGPGKRYEFIAGFNGEPDGFKNFFGTSAAAPNAAAVAALMLQVDPTLTPAQVIAIQQMTAIDVTGSRAGVGVDDVTGPGLIDAKAAVDAALLP